MLPEARIFSQSSISNSQTSYDNENYTENITAKSNYVQNYMESK
jgi:hypothetical protein